MAGTPTTAILDMDGTLLDLHFDQQLWHCLLPRRLAEIQRVSLPAAQERVRSTLAAAAGSLAWYCLDHWSEVFELDVPALEHELQDLIKIRTGTEAFLQYLQQSGVHTVLATNAHPKSLGLKLRKTGIGQYFSHICSSHDYGLPKEDAGFWQRLATDTSFALEHTLFVDDNPQVLRAAAAFGIAHVYSVRRPSSSGREVLNTEFPSIDALTELIPLLFAADAALGPGLAVPPR